MRATTDQHEWSGFHKKESNAEFELGLAASSRTRLTEVSNTIRRMPEQEAAASEAHGNNDEVSEDKGYL
jgi:hypothetical protein